MSHSCPTVQWIFQLSCKDIHERVLTEAIEKSACRHILHIMTSFASKLRKHIHGHVKHYINMMLTRSIHAALFYILVWRSLGRMQHDSVSETSEKWPTSTDRITKYQRASITPQTSMDVEFLRPWLLATHRCDIRVSGIARLKGLLLKHHR